MLALKVLFLNKLSYIYGLLGEVMMTQVIIPNAGSVIRDPRRKSRITQFKHSSHTPYKVNYGQDYDSSPRSSVWTGTSIVLGSVLFMIMYFLITGAKKLKK